MIFVLADPGLFSLDFFRPPNTSWKKGPLVAGKEMTDLNKPPDLMQPRDKAAMFGVNTIEFFLEEFTRKQSLAARGEKCFCSWPPTWPP